MTTWPDTFVESPDGSRTAFTLASGLTPLNETAFVGGALRVRGIGADGYSVNGPVLTFVTAPATGETMVCYFASGLGAAPGDLTSLANVKLWLGITDSSADAILSRLITTESATFRKLVGREFVSQTYVETIDGSDPRVRRGPSPDLWTGPFPGVGGIGSGWAVNLANWPVISVTSVVVDGEPIPAGSDAGESTQVDGWVLVDSYRIELLGASYSITGGVQNVVITYVAGYAAIPDDIDQAVCELVGYRYRERDRIGQRSKTLDSGTVSFMTDLVPPSVQAVIDSYRRVNI